MMRKAVKTTAIIGSSVTATDVLAEDDSDIAIGIVKSKEWSLVPSRLATICPLASVTSLC
jgi:hypothetical protein